MDTDPDIHIKGPTYSSLRLWFDRTRSFAWRWLTTLGKPSVPGFVVMVEGTGVQVPTEKPGEFAEFGLYAKRIIRGGTEVEAREAAIRHVTDELLRSGCLLDDSRSSLSIASVERGLIKRTAPKQLYGFTFYSETQGAGRASS